MKRFSDLYWKLDGTTSTNQKIEALKEYFVSAPPEDAACGLRVLCEPSNYELYQHDHSKNGLRSLPASLYGWLKKATLTLAIWLRHLPLSCRTNRHMNRVASTPVPKRYHSLVVSKKQSADSRESRTTTNDTSLKKHGTGCRPVSELSGTNL